MIFVLFFITLAIFFFTFVMADNDIMFPGCIVCLVWLFGEICVVYNIGYWNVDLTNRTVIIYVTTILIFVIMAFIGDNILKKIGCKYKSVGNQFRETNSIQLTKGIYIFFFLFNVIVAIIVIKSVWKSAGINSFIGNENYSIAMSQYRSSDDNLPGIVKQLYKIMKCDSYIFLYLFCQNLQKRINQNATKYLLPCIFFGIASLSTGSRTEVLQFFIAAIVMIYIKMQQEREWSKKLNFKYIVGCILAIVLFLFLFDFIKTFVGRLNGLDPIRYITGYAGGSIELFDLYLKGNTVKSQQFGQLTFYSLWQNIEKMKLGIWQQTGLEFRISNGHLIGNLYTSIRRYYQDFGIVGNYLLQSVMALFYAGWYRMIKKNRKYDNAYSIIMYCMIVSPLFLHAIDDTFFSGFLCINTVVFAIITRIIYLLFIGKIKLKLK